MTELLPLLVQAQVGPVTMSSPPDRLAVMGLRTLGEVVVRDRVSGSSRSFTVKEKLLLAVRPLASVAVKVAETVVVASWSMLFELVLADQL